MLKKHILKTTWAKAYGEVYCHHASLFIPANSNLFTPELVQVGISICTKKLKGKKIETSERRIARFLPCSAVDGGIIVRLNSSSIIDALSLNSWTTLGNGSRGMQKEFPANIFYKSEYDNGIILPFKLISDGDEKNDYRLTPYLINEPLFASLKDGDKIDTEHIFDVYNTNFQI